MAFGKAYVAPKLNILNEQLEFAQLEKPDAAAFYGKVRKVKLEPGFQLYKFTRYPLKNDKGKITPWWSPVQPYEIDPGLQARLDLARHLQVHPSDLTRSFAAVSEDWNTLTSILTVRIKRAGVYALWGQVAGQARQQGDFRNKESTTPANQQGAGIDIGDGRTIHIRTMNLPGKAWQFFIPNLTDDWVVEVSKTLVEAPRIVPGKAVIRPKRPG